MKKRLTSVLLAALMLILCITPAYAATGAIDEAIPDWKNLTVIVSVSGGTSVTFMGSVDDSAMVELPATAYPAEDVGHIIVVDLGYTWTKYITIDTIVPVINAYIDTLPNGHMVKIIMADGETTSGTGYMNKAAAKSHVSSLVLPNKVASQQGKPSYTLVDSALNSAFTEAATPGNGPTFKSVFALVDLGNSNANTAATATRESYIDNGGSFPVTIAAIYPTDYMKNSSSSAAAKTINNNVALYNGFAESNGGSLIRLNCDNSGQASTAGLSGVQHNRSYYTVSLAPLHELINYELKTHTFVIQPNVGRVKGNQRGFDDVSSNELPPSLATPAPPTPTPQALNLRCAPTTSSITLTWDRDPADGVTYTVTCDGIERVSGLTANSYTDSELLPGKSYTYKVTAYRNGVKWMEETASILTETTPTPPPTPDPYAVRLGDEGDKAIEAIYYLRKLYYLDTQPSKYDGSCASAFMDFCEVNGLPKESEISVAAFAVLTSSAAVPQTTETPPPPPEPTTPTPEVTIAPPVHSGADNPMVIRTIRLLESLFYLDEGDKSKWDGECMFAFLQMCEDNGIPFPQDLDYINEEWYEMIVAKREFTMVPKVTVTPVPEITTPPPATIPPEGYALYSTDTADSDFIAQMQTGLDALNMYPEGVNYTIGQLDQPTLDAVALYCATYGVNLPDPYVVDARVVNDIITNGGNRVAYVEPDPTMGEKITEFLQRDVMLGSFAVKMWILVAVVVALIFIILLIVILTNRKANDHSGSSFPVQQGRGRQGGASLPNPTATSAPVSGGSSFPSSTVSGGDFDETVAVGRSSSADDDMTMKLGSGINVTLNISGGVSAGVRRVLIGDTNYIIGRPAASGASCDLALEGDRTISRKHAALSYQQNQLYLYSLSDNGTRVNGQPIDNNRTAAMSEETLPLSAAANRSNGGYAIKRGDTIEIGNYRITVSW